MQFFAVLTLQISGETITATTVATVDATATRQALYERMRQSMIERSGKRFRNASVVFFSAEPNTISS